ncbi:MAG: hydroxymethylglutaryl-CoA lyase [Phycisphaeraceae bacterium]|nr:hydroxymethylglutaryl-CoA lyase [Phycisphaeraceae bacterium]
MAERVRITDVSPRDGLQNEPGVIPTAEKVRLIELLGATGVDEIEVTSFVSPKWVPQLGDAADVCRLLARFDSAPAFSALVPNERGMRGVLETNESTGRSLISRVSVFTAASETFSKRNTNATIAETLERFLPVISMARTAGLGIRGYVSCAIACPFEGSIKPSAVADVSRRLADLGVDEIDLGDTIGAGTRESTAALLRECNRWVPLKDGSVTTTLHLHDTFGRAGECVRTALEMGIRSFDGSVAGLGGCPYASTPQKRAPGNVSTELLVKTVHEAGFETGVKYDRLGDAARYAQEIVARARTSAQPGNDEVPA